MFDEEKEEKKSKVYSIICFILVIVISISVYVFTSCESNTDKNYTVHVFDGSNNGKGKCYKVDNSGYHKYGRYIVEIDGKRYEFSDGTYVENCDSYCLICGR